MHGRHGFRRTLFDLQAFAKFVKQQLPSYAMPLFLRKLKTMPVTGTMKQEKAKLHKEGMNPSKISDRLWVFNRDKDKYELLTSESYHHLVMIFSSVIGSAVSNIWQQIGLNVQEVLGHIAPVSWSLNTLAAQSVWATV